MIVSEEYRVPGYCYEERELNHPPRKGFHLLSHTANKSCSFVVALSSPAAEPSSARGVAVQAVRLEKQSFERPGYHVSLRFRLKG
jgi:hypothetical protein